MIKTQYFLFVDRELLDLYEACETEKEVREVERNWLDKCEEEYQAVKKTGTSFRREQFRQPQSK